MQSCKQNILFVMKINDIRMASYFLYISLRPLARVFGHGLNINWTTHRYAKCRIENSRMFFI